MDMTRIDSKKFVEVYVALSSEGGMYSQGYVKTCVNGLLEMYVPGYLPVRRLTYDALMKEILYIESVKRHPKWNNDESFMVWYDMNVL